MRRQARTPTARCCTRREISPVDVADEASQCTMEAVDRTKEEGTEVMPTAIADPPETGPVEAMKIGKGSPPRNVGIVERKSTTRASVGRSALIRKEPGPDPDPDRPTKEIGNVRTTPKDSEKPEKCQSS